MKHALAIMLLAGFVTAGVAPCFADDTKSDAKTEVRKAIKKSEKKAEKKSEKKDDAAKK